MLLQLVFIVVGSLGSIDLINFGEEFGERIRFQQIDYEIGLESSLSFYYFMDSAQVQQRITIHAVSKSVSIFESCGPISSML